MIKKTKFNLQWKDPNLFPQFASWVTWVKSSPHQFYCTYCMSPLELGNMGKGALSSHILKNETHKKIVKVKGSATGGIQNFFTKNSKNTTPTEKPDQPAQLVQPTLCSHVNVNAQKMEAEILWALKIVGSHYSFNSSQNISDLFSHMFPDSEICKKAKLGKTKMSYTVNYGLAPYFKEQLVSQLKKCDEIVVCFDEAFNVISGRGQMDIVVRYWDDKTNKCQPDTSPHHLWGTVVQRMSCQHSKMESAELLLHSIMQVSMDGPNVNWSFLKMFNAYLQTNCDEKTLINLGSCGLHVVHGSLKTGHSAAKWSVHQILRSMYNLFKTSPAQRSDLCAIKPDTKFPLKFFKVRSCGNTPACTRAIEVYDYKTFLETKKLSSTYTVKTLKS